MVALGHWRGLAKDAIDPATAATSNLASAVQPRGGEPRAIHRRPYRRRKPIPKRLGMLAPYGDQIRDWMENDPSLSAVAALERLTTLAPDIFGPKHLRTLQRAIAAQRMTVARRLISDGVSSLLVSAPIPPSVGFLIP
ncbi:hypothetical protein [Lichenifustis flavocetrariae]|uniref:Uncharacterized protein n=1 Tax=Lichenifustis flavocetrariae TaxID=2949735 RepID=A0AA42CS72_9HYPH|nr:hypothetical protein [Lichenifustis flavocetrariae]MCW6513232.1 hypothetical protein [Lichenifustis flavocetrariae]